MPEASSGYSQRTVDCSTLNRVADVFSGFSINLLSRRDIKIFDSFFLQFTLGIVYNYVSDPVLGNMRYRKTNRQIVLFWIENVSGNESYIRRHR